MVIGVPGVHSESAQKPVEVVWSIENENVTTLHRPMGEKIAKDHSMRLGIVIYIHALVR